MHCYSFERIEEVRRSLWRQFTQSLEAGRPRIRLSEHYASGQIDNVSTPIDLEWVQENAEAVPDILHRADRLPAGSRILLDVDAKTAADLQNSPIPAFHVTAQQGFLDLTEAALATAMSRASGLTPIMWQRILSWCDSDDVLAEFIEHIERVVFSRCSTSICNRSWLILETQQLIPQMPGMLVDHLSRSTVHLTAAEQLMLSRYLASLRCQVAWFRLSEWLRLSAKNDPDSLLDAIQCAKMLQWRKLEATDRKNLRIARNWHQVSPLKEILTFKGINLGEVREYDSFCLFQLSYVQDSVADGQ